MTPELLRLMDALSIDEKVELIKHLREALLLTPLQKVMPNPRVRAEQYRSILLQLTGLDAFSKWRDYPLCYLRAMIAYKMRSEGYSTTQVGRGLAKDHSTITHYERMIEDVLHTPEAFADINEIYNKFIALI